MKKSQLMLKIQNNIEVFENPIFGQIRMVMFDDEPMFCLVDVCRALGISNPTMVAQRLDEDERTKLDLGRAGESNFITESGLYAVILRSANELNRWLSDMHVQYKVNGTWVMYSDYSDKGYEDIKQEVLDSGKVVYHRKITQIGREFIISLFQSRKYA